MTRSPLTLGVKWLVAAALLSLSFTPAALAQGRDAIIEDCSDDGRLSGDYSKGDLRDARQNLPADVAEYTDCADVLRRAELGDGSGGGSSSGGSSGGAGGFGTSGGSGGGTAGGSSSGGPLLKPSDAELKSLDRIRGDKASEVEVGGKPVLPGTSGFTPAGSGGDLPGSLVAALIGLGVLALAAGIPLLRRRLGGNGPTAAH